MKSLLYRLLTIVSDWQKKRKRKKTLKKKLERLKELDPHNYTIY